MSTGVPSCASPRRGSRARSFRSAELGCAKKLSQQLGASTTPTPEQPFTRVDDWYYVSIVDPRRGRSRAISPENRGDRRQRSLPLGARAPHALRERHRADHPRVRRQSARGQPRQRRILPRRARPRRARRGEDQRSRRGRHHHRPRRIRGAPVDERAPSPGEHLRVRHGPLAGRARAASGRSRLPTPHHDARPLRLHAAEVDRLP